MKKISAFLTLILVTACMTSCSSSEDKPTASVMESESQPSASENESIEKTTEKETSVSSESATQDSFNETSDDSNKILIAYFSATGTTREIAESISLEIDADLYEIQPVQAYTDEDLNYNNDSCRANIEQNNKSSRPEISGTIDNFENYKIVLIGYPIWWGEEPRIIDTFMETYDFSDMTVVPFCTSGGSGISTSESNLREICPNADWIDGKRFSDSSEVADWISNLGI